MVFLVVAFGPWVVGGGLGYFFGSRPFNVPLALLAILAVTVTIFYATTISVYTDIFLWLGVYSVYAIGGVWAGAWFGSDFRASAQKAS